MVFLSMLLCFVWTERRRREAISAATCLTEALVDHLNVGYEMSPLHHDNKIFDM